MRRAADGDELAVSVDADGVRSPVARALLARASRETLRSLRVSRAMISIALVTRRRIARLNREHLAHAGPTDIITFALGGDAHAGVVGDVYISPEVARENARTAGVPLREEMIRLVIHGTLHACGWTHPEGEERAASPMWQRQERLVHRLRGALPGTR